MKKKRKNKGNKDSDFNLSVLALIVSALISVASLISTGLTQRDEIQLRENEVILKTAEVDLKLRQLNDSLDPKIIEALLDEKKRSAAIKLGNGLYIHNDTARVWWCNVVKEVAPDNSNCSTTKISKA